MIKKWKVLYIKVEWFISLQAASTTADFPNITKVSQNLNKQRLASKCHVPLAKWSLSQYEWPVFRALNKSKDVFLPPQSLLIWVSFFMSWIKNSGLQGIFSQTFDGILHHLAIIIFEKSNHIMISKSLYITFVFLSAIFRNLCFIIPCVPKFWKDMS